VHHPPDQILGLGRDLDVLGFPPLLAQPRRLLAVGHGMIADLAIIVGRRGRFRGGVSGWPTRLRFC